MYGQAPCQVCKHQASRGSSQRGILEFECPRCGNFATFMGGSSRFSSLEPAQVAQLSGWIREQNDIGEYPYLSSDVVDRVLAMRPKEIPERVDRLLRWAAAAQQTLDGQFSFGKPELVARTYSQSIKEVFPLLQFLAAGGYVKSVPEGKWQLTPQGFIECEKGRTGADARTAFIAMWFNEEMAEARNVGLVGGVRASGYEAVVVNDVEHNQKIDDRIVAEIRKAKFLVADFTGHRGGVYFEAGFAMGLGRPVIWACRKDQMDQLHFDIRQYNCIDWETPDDLAVRLARRIGAVIGEGPLHSPS